MNGKYIFRVLLEAKEDFEKHLFETALTFPVLKPEREVIDSIISFSSAAILDFRGRLNNAKQKLRIRSSYDLLQWRRMDYQTVLEDTFNPQKYDYTLYIPTEQAASLKKLTAQYKHSNLNVTLRKMSEYMAISDFFYRIVDKDGTAIT